MFYLLDVMVLCGKSLFSSETMLLLSERARQSTFWNEASYVLFTRTEAFNSKDPNPVDCNVWEEMYQRVYQTKVEEVDQLKQRLIGGFEHSIIDDTTAKWRKRIHMHIRVKGGYFER